MPVRVRAAHEDMAALRAGEFNNSVLLAYAVPLDE
jgi:hypothetical protein